MSYAIGYVVYGIPYSYDIAKAIASNNKDEDYDVTADNADEIAENESWFEFRYSGNGEPPGWCGVVLDRIDECNNLKVSELNFQPSDMQKKTAEDKINNLPEYVRKVSNQADVYILWGSS